jgi:hypothetical protein
MHSLKDIKKELTEDQKTALNFIHLTAINTTNSIDILTFDNQYSETPEAIDEAIRVCVSNIMIDYNRIPDKYKKTETQW